MERAEANQYHQKVIRQQLAIGDEHQDPHQITK